MDDLISRQAAIEALKAKKDKSAKGDIGCFYNTIIQNTIDAIKDLPSAQPEQKTGQWELAIGYDPKRKFMCDQCARMAYEQSKYCPNCGAKMGSEDVNDSM